MFAVLFNRPDVVFPALVATICIVGIIAIILILRSKHEEEVTPRFTSLSDTPPLKETGARLAEIRACLDDQCIEIAELKPSTTITIETESGSTYIVTIVDPISSTCAVSKMSSVPNDPQLLLLTGTSVNSFGSLVRLGGISPHAGFHIVFQYPDSHRHMILTPTVKVTILDDR